MYYISPACHAKCSREQCMSSRRCLRTHVYPPVRSTVKRIQKVSSITSLAMDNAWAICFPNLCTRRCALHVQAISQRPLTRSHPTLDLCRDDMSCSLQPADVPPLPLPTLVVESLSFLAPNLAPYLYTRSRIAMKPPSPPRYELIDRHLQPPWL